MSSLNFGPIKTKMSEIEVLGQACTPKEGCNNDCKREVWDSNSSSYVQGCYIRVFYDSHWSACS